MLKELSRDTWINEIPKRLDLMQILGSLLVYVIKYRLFFTTSSENVKIVENHLKFWYNCSWLYLSSKVISLLGLYTNTFSVKP